MKVTPKTPLVGPVRTGPGKARRRMVPSVELEARVCPPAPNATAVTGAGWGSLMLTCPVARSHMVTVSSEHPAAMLCPSGLNTTALTQLVGPVSGAGNGTGPAGAERVHRRPGAAP